MKKQINIKILKTVPTGGGWDGNVSIEITDCNSRLLIAEIKMPFLNFGKLIASNTYVDAEATIYDTFENLGKDKEHKTVYIIRDIKYNDKKEKLIEEITKALISSNVIDESWKYDSDRLGESRHRNSDGGYPITFYRYIERGESEN